MKLNQKLQLGILFVLYLCRAGKANIESAAEGLEVSKSFLEQVARQLRLTGIVRSSRGPGGGYELVGEPTVGQMFKALSPVKLLDTALLTSHEKRSLCHLASSLTAAMNPIMNRKIRSVGMDLVAMDLAKLDRLQYRVGMAKS